MFIFIGVILLNNSTINVSIRVYFNVGILQIIIQFDERNEFQRVVGASV